MIPIGSAGKIILSAGKIIRISATAAVLLRRQFEADAALAQRCGVELELVLQGFGLVDAERPGDLLPRREADKGETVVLAPAYGVGPAQRDHGLGGAGVLRGDDCVFSQQSGKCEGMLNLAWVLELLAVHGLAGEAAQVDFRWVYLGKHAM